MLYLFQSVYSISKRFTFMKKTALITGASRGIGKAIAEKFAEKGYHLILTCFSSICELQEFSSFLEKTYNISCIHLHGYTGNVICFF